MHDTNSDRKQSQKSRVLGNGRGWMLCLLHMLPPEEKSKGKLKVPFHVRHRTKETPFTYQGEHECFPGSFADASSEHGDSSTLSMTENSTVVQNELLILTFILIQFAEES